MDDRIFIISCYFDGSNSAIFKCANSIIKYYKNPKIVVVDSDSPDKSYFKILQKKNICILDIKNRNYDTGAYWKAYKKFSNFKFYYFLQDSLIFKRNLSKFEIYDFTSIRYFISSGVVGGFKLRKTKNIIISKLVDLFKTENKIHDLFGFDNSEQLKWAMNKLKYTDYFFPKTWISLFGPVFFCKPFILDKLIAKKFDLILPENKLQQMAMERLFGIALQQEGVDITNSIQGDHFIANLANDYIEKKFYRRK